jgi:RNA polymerase sigma-70 factor, ECF subfamily
MADLLSCLPIEVPPASLATRNLLNAQAVADADPQKRFGQDLIAQLPALRRYTIALAGSVPLAEDLVQDCIERALRQSHQLRDRNRLGAWLRSIAYNLYIDDRRRSRTRGVEEDVADVSDDPALVTRASDQAETSAFVRAMNSLTPEHRQILLLVGLEDMNYREIAAELGVPIGTVMSRLARARERLRAALDDDGTGFRPRLVGGTEKKVSS